MGGLIYGQQSEDSKKKAAFYEVRYNLAKERLPKTPVDSYQIKIAVDAIDVINDYKASPYEMLSTLGNTLENFPDIKIDKIDWGFSIDPNRNMVTTDNTLNLIGNTGENEQPIKYYQISNLDAHIEPFDGNYREAISMVNKFAETLREDSEIYKVIIESMPLDISSAATLQGNTGVADKVATFSLQVVLGVN